MNGSINGKRAGKSMPRLQWQEISRSTAPSTKFCISSVYQKLKIEPMHKLRQSLQCHAQTAVTRRGIGRFRRAASEDSRNVKCFSRENFDRIWCNGALSYGRPGFSGR